MEETGLTKTDIIREGIDALYSRIGREKERRCGMYSFKDVNGNNIPFEERSQLSLDLQKDVVSGDITAYLVECDETIYQVDKKTYNVLEEM